MKDNTKKSEFELGKIIFWNLLGNQFTGLCPNKLGNVIYLYDFRDNKKKNKSNRPIYPVLETNKYFLYFKLQDAELKQENEFNFYLNKRDKGFPKKNSIIYLDNLYIIEKTYLDTIINKNHIDFLNTKPLDTIVQKRILEKYLYLLQNKKENITIQNIIYKNLNNDAIPIKVIHGSVKVVFYNNVSKILWVSRNQLEKEISLNLKDLKYCTLDCNHNRLIRSVKDKNVPNI